MKYFDMGPDMEQTDPDQMSLFINHKYLLLLASHDLYITYF